LAVMKGYSKVHPRLPKGGRDGGRDIQAKYEGDLCFGAVGFVNDAADIKQHRDQIKRKFRNDLKSACSGKSEQNESAKAFVFFTNVGLTPTIIAGLKAQASEAGMAYCDILDREHLRIALDSSKGYAIRFRYLDIALSDAEQKDFFSTWADEINAMMVSELGGIDQTIKRVQFLLEAQFLVDSLTTVVRLDKSLWDATKGNFVFQTSLSLQTHSDGLIGLYAGGGNEPIVQTPEQLEASGENWPRNSQFGYSFDWLIPGTPQYKKYVEEFESLEQPSIEKTKDKKCIDYVRTFSSSGILDVSKEVFDFWSGCQPFLHRFSPTFKLIELDSCMILFDCSRAFADAIENITILANGYELLNLSKEDWKVMPGSFDRFKLPKEATQTRDSSEWATLRPSKMSSAFTIDLMSRTPRRYDWK